MRSSTNQCPTAAKPVAIIANPLCTNNVFSFSKKFYRYFVALPAVTLFAFFPIPGFSQPFYHLHDPSNLSCSLQVKAFLQGAYNSLLGRHKNVTAAWAAALNTGTGGNALNQPYNTAPFGNYNGGENVTAGFFTSTPGGSPNDVLDWVLLELRDAATPSIVVARCAAFIRCDGRIVNADISSNTATPNEVEFNGAAAGNGALTNGYYFLAIRHRNHLGIRSSISLEVDANISVCSGTPSVYDFSSSNFQAYRISGWNEPMTKDVNSGKWIMWGGNAKADNWVRTMPVWLSDLAFLMSTINGINNVLTNRYNNADMNMDGTVRATGATSGNDALFLLSIVLGGNIATAIRQIL